MKLIDPINIMLDCCIPDKKKLMTELNRLAPGETVQIKIDNCVASKAIIEAFLKNKWYRIVDIEDRDDASILHIGMDKEV